MNTDFIVIGSGLAGLTSALVLKDYGRVLLVTKSRLDDCATNLAQGGIAAVVEEDDSFESHIKDTLIAGCFYNDQNAVEYLVRHAPNAINWLVKQGVKFASIDGKFDPTKEAAHSFPRVLHSTDITGREIEKVLISHIKKEKNITVWEDCFVVDLLVKDKNCYGVNVIKSVTNTSSHPELDSGSFKMPKQVRHDIVNIFCQSVILATGGLGQLYEWTTNPTVATGDGIALAVKAGAEVKDMEFIQFHPTALKDGKSPLFLLSEALRGEGAYLVKFKIQNSKVKITWKEERFMNKYDEREELAPRDIVARAIFAEQQKGYEVFLDIRHKGKDFLQKRFPNIYLELERRGFDLSRDLIPVTPATHYSCGGVKTDLYGRTNIKNLFAFGEVACTGVHGANRLASNSLLEAVVFPLRLGNYFRKISKNRQEKLGYKTYFNDINHCSRVDDFPKVDFKRIKRELQQLLWDKVGIVRTEKGLENTLLKIRQWEKELINVVCIDKEVLEIKNMLMVAKLICESALKRKTSLGAHYVI